MTQTEEWVYQTCEGFVAYGQVRLYKSLYKDLRERVPCGVACRLLREGLERSRHLPAGGVPPRAWVVIGDRARAIAALLRLERWAWNKDRAACWLQDRLGRWRAE